MTSPIPAGLDPLDPTPGVKVVTKLGAGARAVSGQRKLMLLGNMTSSGTATVNEWVSVSSPEEGDALFGVGSELALMVRAAFKQNRTADVNACAVAEGTTPTAAAATLVFANNAGSAGVIRAVINGVRIPEVSVASGATPSTIATDFAAAVNSVAAQLPCTAGVSTATVTITARQGGTRGNQLGIEVVLTTTTTTVALNGGSASATRVRGRFVGGLVTETTTFENALNGVKTGEWFYASALNDTTNADALANHIASYAAIDECKRQQGVVALKVETFANAKAYGIARNAQRLMVACVRDQVPGGDVDPWIKSPGEIAADAAAARLYGDAGVGNGGDVIGEVGLPSCNLQGVQLAALTAPSLAATVFTGTELKQLLQSGISPIVPSTKNPGICQLVKSITSYCRANGNLTFAVHSTSKVTVADATADAVEEAILADHPAKNIAVEPDPPRAPPQGATYLSSIRATVLRVLYEKEKAGWLVNVAANEAGVVVEQHPENNEIVVASIPGAVIPQFTKFAGTFLQTG